MALATAPIDSFNPDPDAPVAIDYMTPAAGAISMNGNWARRLLDNELDVGSMRPYIGMNGKTYITRNHMTIGKDGKPKTVGRAIPTMNDSNATLRFLDWILVDEAVIKAAKPELVAARDLKEKGLIYQLPNGIAKTTIQFQAQSDISGATVSMDGLRQSESDRPVFNLIDFPLPIIHKDFQFPLRQVLASRTGKSPLDTTTAELASRRVAEQVEQFVLGCGQNASFSLPGKLQGQAQYNWNGGVVQGYMNYTNRLTYSLTLPTTPGWVPQNTVDDILGMRTASKQAFYNGPWMIYVGQGWDAYMDDDYKPTYNDTTLRDRIRKINGIQDVKTVPYIPDMSILMVQMSTNVVRLVIGMDIMTLQWESHGGMELNFKVMCVMVPQIRNDFYGNTGIVHGS